MPLGPVEWEARKRSWFDYPSPVAIEEQLAPLVEWLDALPFPPGRTVLGGISQGASVAYRLAFAAGRPRPAAVVALIGRMPEQPQLDLSPPLPPVLIGHGTRDEIVPVEAARAARDRLRAAGAEVVYRETAIGHAIDPAVLREVRDFLAGVAARIAA